MDSLYGWPGQTRQRRYDRVLGAHDIRVFNRADNTSNFLLFYHNQDISDTYRFQPISIETTDAIEPITNRFLSEHGRKIVSRTGERKASEWMYQRISVAVMRGNAASIVSCTQIRWRYYGGLKFVPLGFKRLVILQSIYKVKLNLSSYFFLANQTLAKHDDKFNFTL